MSVLSQPLPLELYHEILKHCSADSKHNFRLTCHRWYNLAAPHSSPQSKTSYIRFLSQFTPLDLKGYGMLIRKQRYLHLKCLRITESYQSMLLSDSLLVSIVLMCPLLSSVELTRIGSDASIQMLLSRCPVSFLKLNQCQISDEAIVEAKFLRHLELIDCNVTDVGLFALSDYGRLVTVCISGAKGVTGRSLGLRAKKLSFSRCGRFQDIHLECCTNYQLQKLVLDSNYGLLSPEKLVEFAKKGCLNELTIILPRRMSPDGVVRPRMFSDDDIQKMKRYLPNLVVNQE